MPNEGNKKTEKAEGDKNSDGHMPELQGIPTAFFARDGFNPFNHWKENKEALTEWSERVESAVDVIVEQYHKGFGTATSSFSNILSDFTNSQNLLSGLNDNLTEAQRILAVRNPYLKELYFQNLIYDKVLRILDKIDYVKDVPAQVDEFIANKWHLHTVLLLQHTISMLSDEDLREIAALFDLREDLLTKRNAIKEKLIEELHDLLYVKDRHQHKQDDSSKNVPLMSRKSVKLSISAQLSAAPDLSSPTSATATSTTTTTNGLPGEGVDISLRKGVNPLTSPLMSPSVVPTAPSTPGRSRFSLRFQQNNMFSPFKELSTLSREDAATGPDGGRGKLRLNITPKEVQQQRIATLLHQESASDDGETGAAISTGVAGMANDKDRSLQIQYIVEALDQLHSLPSLQSQIRQRLKNELRSIISEEMKRLVKELQSGSGSAARLARSMQRQTRHGEQQQGSLLLELLRRTFGVYTQVLRLHVEVDNLIKATIKEKAMIATAEAAKEGITVPPKVMGSAPDAVMGVKEVWAVMESELQLMLMGFLMTQPLNAPSKQQQQQAQMVGETEELSFNFEDSLALSVAQGSKLTDEEEKEKMKQQQDREKRANGVEEEKEEEEEEEEEDVPGWAGAERFKIAPVSTYNIVTMYRPVLQLCEYCSNLLGANPKPGSLLEDESRLSNFMNIFIKTSFLPRVEADVNVSVGKILKDPHAFSPREIQIQREGRPGEADDSVVVVKSAIDIMQQLSEVFTDLMLLPQFMTECLMLIEHVLNRYLDACLEKYRFATQGKYAPGRLIDPKVYSLMQRDPDYLAYRGMTPSARSQTQSFGEYEQLFQAEMAVTVYHELNRKEFKLKQSQLLSDPVHLSDLALLAESLEWLSQEIFNLFGPDPSRSMQTASRNVRQNSGSESGARSMTSVRMSGVLMGGSESKRRSMSLLDGRFGSSPNRSHKRAMYRTRQRGTEGEKKIGQGAANDLLDRKRWELAETCQMLADRCLFALRLEMRARAYFHLCNVYYSTYHQPQDPLEPELFVLELNKEMTALEDIFSKYLPGDTIRFLFAGSSKFIPDMLVSALKHIKDRRFNRKGIRKMTRNLFAIQQTLSNISDTEPTAANFDRARQYYDLLLLSPEELQQFRLDNTKLFTPEEYDELTRRQL